MLLQCQETIEGRWRMECGASTNGSFEGDTRLNLRYISPKFRIISEDREWTAEEEEHPEKYKNGRLMLEFFYRPPIAFLGMSANLQYRILYYKKFSLEAYGGLKFFFAAPPDFVINPTVPGYKDIWYINFGFIAQLDLGLAGPFAEIGTDGIITLGTELDLDGIKKKIRRKFQAPYIRSP